MDKDLLLGNIYLPPPNSPYATEDMFTDLEMNLLEVNYVNYHVVLTGDLNAHTLQREDCIDLSDDVIDELNLRNCKDILREHNCKVQRSNQDQSKCNSYGRKLLELCKTTGLCIFNGRLTGDECGSYTTSKNTTIDYVIGTPTILPFVQGMIVEEFDEIFSDIHNKIIVTFRAMLEIRTDTDKPNKVKIRRWAEEKRDEFIDKLDDDVLQNISLLLNDEDSTVDEVNEEITRVLLSSAKNTLGLVKEKCDRIPLADKKM